MTIDLVHRLPTPVRRALYRGSEFQCNVCGFEARAFLGDSWHACSICPSCRSQVRHRLIVALMEQVPGVSFKELIDGRSVLHFAPEDIIRDRIRTRAKSYIAADLMTTGYRYALDIVADICQMPGVAVGSIDTLIACDVLEHVADDSAALAEIRRVLAPSGTAILTVPQQDGLEVTDEEPSITDPAERERRFGQFDHVRMYGRDFTQRLERAGFRVTALDHTSFDLAAIRRHILFPPIPSSHPLATNHRWVYFARKQQ